MTSIDRIPRAVFFDWDGTLADTHESEFSILTEVMVRMGRPPLSRETYANSPSLSVKDYFSSIFSAQDYNQAVQCYMDIASQGLQHLKVFSSALRILELLKEKKILMGVVSNKEAGLLRNQVAHVGWQHFFSTIVGSGDTPMDKPSSVPLLYALQSSNQTPGEDVWFVGDSEVDMICASDAGCLPVSVGSHADGFKGHFLKTQNCQGFYDFLVTLISLEK